MILYEEYLYLQLRVSSLLDWNKLVEKENKLSQLDAVETPGLVAACKDILLHKIHQSGEITPQYAYKLYDTFGLDVETMVKLAKALELKFNPNGFHDEMAKVNI